MYILSPMSLFQFLLSYFFQSLLFYAIFMLNIKFVNIHSVRLKFQMIKKWVIPNFALIMSESVAEIDLHQKNSLFTMSFFANPGWVKWHPLKQTKSKNKHHFFIPTFWVIQLYFLVRKDSSTPKVLKIHFVSGWSVNKEHCIFNLQCSLSWLSQRQSVF